MKAPNPAFCPPRTFLQRTCLVFLIILLAPSIDLRAQEDFPEYFELSVEMTVPEMGTVEFPIAIQEEIAYLPVKDLFDFLQLKAEPTATGLEGFIAHQDSTYTINTEDGTIAFGEKLFQLKEEDVIQTPTTLYLNTELFGEIFGLNADFSFRTLSINLNPQIDLPVIKQRKRTKLRKNLDQVQGTITPDTTLQRRSPLFRAGMLDWGIVTTQQSEIENDNRINLGMGTLIAGGEANLMLNYSTRVPFESRNQFYQWRYVNNDHSFLKQVTAGRIFTRATSSLFAPVAGIQVSNSPLQNRKSFGTHTISDYTEPNWVVELYVNNVLVDFVEADASGFYMFEVPLMYGNTNVDLRFYGPWGEERVENRVINIPYNFVPKNEFEYTLSAGVVENDEAKAFSRFNFNYGLSNAITFGGGVEYLSGVASGEVMPFANASIKLAPSLLFAGEYTFGVKGEALLSYRSPSNLQVDLNYITYDENQTAINYNYLEERKLSFSFPIRGENFSLFSRFSLNQIIMPTTEFTTAQLLLSGALFGVSTNLTTYGIYNDRINKPTIYSTLSQSYRLPYRWMLSPQLQYDFSKNTTNSLILELERPVFSGGFFNLSYENNMLRDSHIFEVGLRYTFNFAQTALSSRIGNHSTSFVQSARGSILLDDNTGFITPSNRSAISRGGLTIVAFLDYNSNGIKDELEPKVPGLEIKNSYGRATYSADRTILRVLDLQPYIELILELEEESLDNIAWRIPNPKIAVETVPNYFKEIFVPVEVMGEVGGMVYFQSESGTRGQGRIIVNIFDESGQRVTRILSEGDGYFTFLGLPPGKYTAEIDKEQLKTLSYTAEPGSIPFEIEVSEYGDIVDTLEFTLRPLD